MTAAIPFLFLFFWDRVLLCCPGWSAVTQSQLTEASTSILVHSHTSVKKYLKLCNYYKENRFNWLMVLQAIQEAWGKQAKYLNCGTSVLSKRYPDSLTAALVSRNKRVIAKYCFSLTPQAIKAYFLVHIDPVPVYRWAHKETPSDGYIHLARIFSAQLRSS